MIEELRTTLLKERMIKAQDNYSSARSRMIFWWVVFAVGACSSIFFNLRIFRQTPIRHLQAGFTFLAVVSFCLGLLAYFRWRGTKVELDSCRAIVTE
jgi:hypothetical protein